MSAPCKRKQWTPESMDAAVSYVKNENSSLREAARLYNVPVETLRRRVIGSVEMGCKPGPPTVLTTEEETRLAKYLVDMVDMGFGLSREDVMAMAFNIAERMHKNHPFKDGFAGRGWYDGFMARHPKLTLRTPQPLSYARALCSNKAVIDDFFEKLGGIYGRLNFISKPMQIFNSDESGIGIVHKPGKVVAEVGRRSVHSITSAEKGKNHTIVSCVSASGIILPPLMIYPRKRSLPDKAKEGAVPGTLFMVSENGWINREIYLEWFRFFLRSIPPARPVLLIQDGHASHISIELIELAQANDIHLMCLPAHTTHILQPLDVGVFKSFKLYFSKACHRYITAHPGRVITTDLLASLVGEAWPQSLTPLNILSGFRKCGIYPFNPGEISDRQIAPSKAITPQPTSPQAICGSPLFSIEQQELYEKRHQEGCDINDPDYMAWLKINHPCSISSTHGACSESLSSCASATKQSSESSILDDILSLPKPVVKTTKKRKPAINHKAVVLTEGDVVHDLKAEEEDRRIQAAEQVQRKHDREQKQRQKKIEIEAKKKEREQKKKDNEIKKREMEEKKKEREQQKEIKKREAEEKKKEKEKKKKEKEKKKKEREQQKESKKMEKKDREQKKMDKEIVKKRVLDEAAEQLGAMSLGDTCSGNSELVTVCRICGRIYGDEVDVMWIGCDNPDCEEWYDFGCAGITKDNIPDKYYCIKCNFLPVS